MNLVRSQLYNVAFGDWLLSFDNDPDITELLSIRITIAPVLIDRIDSEVIRDALLDQITKNIKEVI